MKTVQDIFKECDIRESLLVLLAGVPENRSSKMFEQYYSLYCVVMATWYGQGVTDYILTGFRKSEYKNGKKVYSFYSKNLETPVNKEVEKIDWNEVVRGKIKVYIPDYVTEKITNDVLCSMLLYQIYEWCTVDVPQYTNKLLFDSMKCVTQERKSDIAEYESWLEMLFHYSFHYSMEKDYINNAILEYKESKCNSFKWGELLREYDWEIGIPNHILYSYGGLQILHRNLQLKRLPEVYSCFHKLDNENPPDLRRLYIRLKSLEANYEDIGLSEYLEVANERKRIIVEKNACYKKLPLIYIRDGKGNQSKLCEVELSELLCMNIYLLDEEITKPEQVLALIGFYLEYPIKVERIQRKYFVQSLMGMKIGLITKEASGAENGFVSKEVGRDYA